MEKKKKSKRIIAQVIKGFTLKDFKKIKIVKRIGKSEKGRLFRGDILECDEQMANYLLKDNKKQEPFIEILEIIP